MDFAPKSAPPISEKSVFNSSLNDDSNFIFPEINSIHEEFLTPSNFTSTTTTTPFTLSALNNLQKTNSNNLKSVITSTISDQLSFLSDDESLTKNSLNNLIDTKTTLQHQKSSLQKPLNSVSTIKFNLNNEIFASQKLHKMKSLSHSPSLISLENRYVLKIFILYIFKVHINAKIICNF